jgi:hypothetical protein
MAAPKTPMTKSHKAALAVGRAESRTVRDYLEAVRRNKPKRGRKRTPDSIKKRLAVIENQFDDSDPADIKRKISHRKLHNVLMTYMQELPKVFFARKCFNLLTSKHAQR